jgi:hypothetical protein
MNTIIIFHRNELTQVNEESLLKNIGELLLHLGSEPIQFHVLNEEETLKYVMHEVSRPKQSATDTDILTKVDSWCKTLVKITGIPSKLVSKEGFATLVGHALTSNINLRNTEVLTRLSQMTENDTALIDVLKINKLNGFISAKEMAGMLRALKVLGYVEQ